MKVLFVVQARSFWLFEVARLNPRGLSFQAVFGALKERYQFAQFPKNALDLDEQRTLSFKAGTFVNRHKTPVLVGFSIYNDGWHADTLSSTDDSTQFLEEVAAWMEKDFGFVIPEVKKAYLSQIDFESSVSLSRLNPSLNQVAQLIGNRYGSVDAQERRFGASGLSFWTEDFGKPLAPASFKFERKIGAPFAADHYFSQAPLDTKSHLEVLQQIESILIPEAAPQERPNV